MNGGIDFVEQAQVVEAALGSEHVLLAKWSTRLDAHFPTSHSGTRVVQAIQEDLADEELLAFVNIKDHADCRRLRSGGRVRNVTDIDGGVGKTIVKIPFENRVAVVSQTGFVEPLAFFRGQLRSQLLRRNVVVARDTHRTHPRLRAFFDLNIDSDLHGIAQIVVLQLTGHLYLAKARRAVQLLNVTDVPFEQRIAVAPVAKQPARGLAQHLPANQVVFKQLVARNSDGREPVAVARSDGINHAQILTILRASLADGNGCGKVPEGLQVVLKVAAAFVEQVIIDRALFVDWNKFAKLTLADAESVRGNFDDRAAFHLKGVVHGVAFRTVGADCDRDLCEQAILLLIARANPL